MKKMKVYRIPRNLMSEYWKQLKTTKNYNPKELIFKLKLIKLQNQMQDK